MNVHDGYFDHISTILSARQHPIIVLEETAMRWMGAAVSSDEVRTFPTQTQAHAYDSRT